MITSRGGEKGKKEKIVQVTEREGRVIRSHRKREKGVNRD